MLPDIAAEETSSVFVSSCPHILGLSEAANLEKKIESLVTQLFNTNNSVIFYELFQKDQNSNSHG